MSKLDIIDEIKDVCSNMGEPERTEYLKRHFIITRIDDVNLTSITLGKDREISINGVRPQRIFIDEKEFTDQDHKNIFIDGKLHFVVDHRPTVV